MVFWPIYEHFHKKSFFDDVPYWGNPRTTKRFFSEKSFTPKVSQVSFLNIFLKFQKEVLEHFEPHLTYYWGSQNLDPFYFLAGKISKHAACFNENKSVYPCCWLKRVRIHWKDRGSARTKHKMSV